MNTGRMTQRFLSAILILAFMVSDVSVYAQGVVQLPAPGTRLALSPSFAPPLLKGIKVYRNDPFRFDFILDKGDAEATDEQVKTDSTRLIKYFLASLTVPEKDLWVNLSPYEKDRIVPEVFGQTEMGRDLLAQDYILKQITASVIYPDEKTGKEFWAKVYAEALARYGTTDVPVDTFNKVWIVPEKATVFENKDAAFVVESRLRVMLETDYLAMENNVVGEDFMSSRERADTRSAPTNEMTKSIIREVVIPILEKEVNEGKNFAPLRQVYNSLILATWYKRKVKAGSASFTTGSIMGQAYVDQKKTGGIDIADKNEKEKIWSRYVEAFKKGAFNLIKEEQDAGMQEAVPRKYFSGGIVITPNIDYAEGLKEGPVDNMVVIQEQSNLIMADNASTVKMSDDERVARLAIGARSIFHGAKVFPQGMLTIFYDRVYLLRERLTQAGLSSLALEMRKIALKLKRKTDVLYYLVQETNDRPARTMDVLLQQRIYKAIKENVLAYKKFKKEIWNFANRNELIKEKFTAGYNPLKQLDESIDAVLLRLISRKEIIEGIQSDNTVNLADLVAKLNDRDLGLESQAEFRLYDGDAQKEVSGSLYTLLSAVYNLVKNALDVVDEKKGKVVVEIGTDDEGVRIAITDNGPGIPVGVEKKMWELDHTTKETGTGLRLAEVLYAVKDMNGTVTAENVIEGGVIQGARFTIRLPLKTAALNKISFSSDAGVDQVSELTKHVTKEAVLTAIEKRNSFDRPVWLNQQSKMQIANVMGDIVDDFGKLVDEGFFRVIEGKEMVVSHTIYKGDFDKSVDQILRNYKKSGFGFDWESLIPFPQHGKGVWTFTKVTDQPLVITFRGNVLEEGTADKSHQGMLTLITMIESHLKTESFDNLRRVVKQTFKRKSAFWRSKKYMPTYELEEYLMMLLFDIVGIDGTSVQVTDCLIIRNPFAIKSIEKREAFIKRTQESQSLDDSQSVNVKGGIDLDPSRIDMATKNSGEEISLNMDPAMLARWQNASGVMPVIVGIHSLESLQQFMEVIP